MLQPFAAVITVYRAITGAGVELVNCSLMDPEPAADASFIPVTEARVQEYDAPMVELEKLYANEALLQIAEGVSELLKCGVGFTTTVTLSGAEQLLAESVKLYTTDTGSEVVLLSCSLIAPMPVPAD